MGKEPTPLEKVTKDADVLKKQIEKILKESTKNANNKKLKDKEIKLKANFRSCYELIPQVTAISERAEGLSEEDEGPKVKNFEQRKKKEVDRITGWKTAIDETMKKLLPDEEGDAYRKELKKELGGDDEEEEEEEKGLETGEQEGEEDDDDEEEDDEEEDEEDDEEGDETAGETLGDTEKSKADDEDEEEEVEEEEVEEEEVEEEETEEEDEEETSEKVIESKKTSKTTAKEAAADSEDDEDEEEDDEEEDDDDDDEEDEDDEEDDVDGQTTMEATTTGRQFEAICDYKAVQEGDLSFKAGEILTIITTQEDGWWKAENDKGKKGDVPSTYLKMYNKYKDVQKEEDEEEEEEEEEEDEEEVEEDEKKTKPLKKRKSGKELWSGIKKAVNETSVTDVLHALGAVPSGFRVTTLGQKFNMESAYLMKNYLAPKLSNSNFSYRDLFFDPAENKIRAKITREQRIVTIANCRQIPVPGGGLEVKSRHIRMCLFDGQNILSNIHTVRVASVDKDQRTWSFSTRVNDLMDTYQHAEVFVRTSNIVQNIGILFELCVSYVRTNTNERGEFSCGWTHLPLEDENTSQPVQNKTYDLYMSGGTPYEKGVEVDPSISRRTASNSFMSMLSGNKQPRLTVKLSVPKKDQKELIDTLPDTMIGNISLLQMYSFYRQILADTLIRDRIDLESTDIIHSPFLATFPMIADQHDLMKLLRESWIEKLRGIRKADMNHFFSAYSRRRDAEFMKDTFKKVLMESVYPLVNSATFPAYKSGDSEVEEIRQAEIEKFKHNKLAKRGILALLLSSDMSHKPVDLKEVSFSAIGPYCLAQKTVPPVTVES